MQEKVILLNKELSRRKDPSTLLYITTLKDCIN